MRALLDGEPLSYFLDDVKRCTTVVQKESERRRVRECAGFQRYARHRVFVGMWWANNAFSQRKHLRPYIAQCHGVQMYDTKEKHFAESKHNNLDPVDALPPTHCCFGCEDIDLISLYFEAFDI